MHSAARHKVLPYPPYAKAPEGRPGQMEDAMRLLNLLGGPEFVGVVAAEEPGVDAADDIGVLEELFLVGLELLFCARGVLVIDPGQDGGGDFFAHWFSPLHRKASVSSSCAKASEDRRRRRVNFDCLPCLWKCFFVFAAPV